MTFCEGAHYRDPQPFGAKKGVTVLVVSSRLFSEYEGFKCFLFFGFTKGVPFHAFVFFMGCVGDDVSLQLKKFVDRNLGCKLVGFAGAEES